MVSDQKSIKDLTASIGGSGANIAAVAAVIALIGMGLPFIGIQTDMGLGMGNYASSINGFTAGAWTAWLALLAFVAAAGARRVSSLMPYRNLIDMAVIGAVILTLAWVWLFNPVTVELENFKRNMSAMSSAGMSDMATFYPHIGAALLVLATAILFFSRRKS